jgi:hypothetical protein
MPTGLFPSNGCCTVACLQNCYLAMGLQVTISHTVMSKHGNELPVPIQVGEFNDYLKDY